MTAPFAYKVTPEQYFEEIVKLYEASREVEFPHPSISRGRSASISSAVEDLSAHFLSVNDRAGRRYFVDQPMAFPGEPHKYPDIVIQGNDGTIEHLVDIKTDLGWNRNGLEAFCNRWNARMDAVRGKPTSFLSGPDKVQHHGAFAANITYHVVVIAKKNSGRNILAERDAVNTTMENVRVYVLSEGKHPNTYGLSRQSLLGSLEIAHAEFDRLMRNIGA